MAKKNPELFHEQYRKLLSNQADYVEKYAKSKPNEIAIIEHNTGEKIPWKQFNTSVSAFARSRRNSSKYA